MWLVWGCGGAVDITIEIMAAEEGLNLVLPSHEIG